MLLPLAFIILAVQASAFPVKVPGRPKTCKGNPVSPKPITDLQQLNGDWYGLYYFYNITNKEYEPGVPLEQCPKVSVSKATEEDIEKQKAICQNISNVDFDYDKVEIKVQIGEYTVLIAKGDEYYLSLNFCSYLGRMQFMKVSDDVVLIDTPEEGGIRNLYARYVPSEDELNCIVDNIESLDEYIGFPFC